MQPVESLAVKLWKVVGAFTLLVASIFLSAYTVQHLWQWFVVPLFNLPLLSIMQALGLGLFVSYMTKQREYYVEKEDAYKFRLINSIMYPVMALGVGYLIHSYM